MKDIIPAKKQSPILGLTGMGGGVGSNIVAGGAKKTYVEDVFSNWTYRGDNGATQSEPNGIDLVDKGGFVWIKDCDAANNHVLFDTERGVGNMLRLGSTSDGNETVGAGMWAPASNGFTHGNWDGIGQTKKYASWTWANQEGFFKVVKWTGNGVSGRQIPHNLGSVPGFVMTKALDNTDSWRTLHKWDFSKLLYINNNQAGASNSSSAFTSAPDGTNLYVTADGAINANGQEYIAYVFAGGPSDAATSKCVNLNGSSSTMNIGSSSDFEFGTGDYTIEFWVYLRDTTGVGPFTIGHYNSAGGAQYWIGSDGKHRWYWNDGSTNSIDGPPAMGYQWTHCAVTRTSGTTRIFVNGIEYGSSTTNSSSNTIGSNGQNTLIFGVERASGGAYAGYLDGKMSNFRIVKGTSLYTSSFIPPTEPLTNVSGTVLLCMNDSSPTGSTVTPGTINNSGVTANTDTPFDDPEGYKFGDGGDQNLIKCGEYIGTGGSGISPEIDCGWEPQFVMIKSISSTDNWCMFDNIRGMVSGLSPGSADSVEIYLYPNLANTEYTADRLDVTPRGFKAVTSGGTLTNGDGNRYIFVAMRRPDPLVGRPAEAGTDVFAMDTGNGSSTIPSFDSNFVVDYAITKEPAGDVEWYATSRLTGDGNLHTNTNGDQNSNNNWTWDSQLGWGSSNGLQSNDQSWMWKRGAGFDVVTYKGTGGVRNIPHNLSKIPEMVWFKRRDAAYNWGVYHKGANGGTNPHDYVLALNSTAAESNDPNYILTEAPTSISLKVGNSQYTNVTNGVYMVMLFASVTGISKVGYYTGDGTASQTITTGFQPRFLIVRNASNGSGWYVVDTLRGWGSSTDKSLQFQEINAQVNASIGAPTTTGFTMDSNFTTSGQNFIYYAHA